MGEGGVGDCGVGGGGGSEGGKASSGGGSNCVCVEVDGG